jgi:curved DNA-binding protein CbpA
MLEAERYYRILDLEPGASPEEVHQGYLDLTWVWHPDRFAGHPRLQQKALYKLQELNEAHERLRSFRRLKKEIYGLNPNRRQPRHHRTNPRRKGCTNRK